METSRHILTFCSREVSYLKSDGKHFGSIIVERDKSHTKQTKPDFAVPA